MPETKHNLREHLSHLERIHWIDYQIRAGRFPNNNDIASHFELSTKTAQRTIDYLRDRLKMPIEYCPQNRGWFYTESAYPLPAIELLESDLIAILLAEKLARQYAGTAIGPQIAAAFEKVLSALTEKVSVNLTALAEAHSFELPLTTEIDPIRFATIGQAIQQKLTIAMEYYTASTNEIKWRQVNPLHLRNHGGEWYLIAWDHGRQQPLDFHCGRIRELTVTDSHFEWPADFVLTDYLNAGFGMIRGQQPITVELIFDEYQARWMRERGKFHPTEEREELPDGRLKMRLIVTALDGVKRFVMQYGSHVRVIQPMALSQLIQNEIHAMQQIYSEGANQ